MTNPTPLAVTNYHRALLGKIREDLRTGAIPRELFNMRYFDLRQGLGQTNCGTAHCIGGWMRHYAAEAGKPLDFDGTNMSGPFVDLFYPINTLHGFSPEDYRRITPQQAIVAIGLWFDTGRVDWPAIVESVR